MFNVSTRVYVQILTPFEGQMKEIFDVTEREYDLLWFWAASHASSHVSP